MAPKGPFTSEEIQTFVSRPLFAPDVVCSKDSAYPRISVVVPSYNQAKFLERTFLSILNQNYPNTEIIVMDGKSSDGSTEIIRKYEPFLTHWVSEPDRGQPHSINKGFDRATGELVGWQNSDDLYLPGFFYEVADSFRAAPSTQLIYGNIHTIDEHDCITEFWKPQFIPFSLNHLIYLNWNLSSQATFVNRKLIVRAGPLREDIQVGFDWDWFIRIGKMLRHAVLHKAYGGAYRIHSSSKFSTHMQSTRWPIEVQILRSHNIRVRETRPYKRQLWWQPWCLLARQEIYTFLLYKSLSKRLRPLVMQHLARRGLVCWGFD